MIGVPESYSDTSSMMPQKKNFGGQLERIRLDSAMVISRLQEAAVVTKSEPFSDMLAVIRARYPVLEALCVTKKNIKVLNGFFNTVIPNKMRMERLCREGFAGAAELANVLVRKSHISYRKAHHVVGTMVRAAEQQNITANLVDATFLDKAANQVLGRSLGLTDADVHQALDPYNFITSHNVRGGVAPEEVERMVLQRRADLNEAIDSQVKRKEQLEHASAKLEACIMKILKE